MDRTTHQLQKVSYNTHCSSQLDEKLIEEEEHYNDPPVSKNLGSRDINIGVDLIGDAILSVGRGTLGQAL